MILTAEQLLVFDSLRPKAERIARRFSRDVRRYEADDAVQDALILAVQAIHKYDPARATGSVDDYAVAFIRRRLVDRYRALFGCSVRQRGRYAVSRAESIDGAAGRADRCLASVDERDECLAALDAMHPGHRLVAEALYLDGLTMREAARRLGVTFSYVSKVAPRLRGCVRIGPDGRVRHRGARAPRTAVRGYGRPLHSGRIEHGDNVGGAGSDCRPGDVGHNSSGRLAAA